MAESHWTGDSESGGGGGGGGPDTTSIARDGSRPPTADQNWNSFKLTNVEAILLEAGTVLLPSLGVGATDTGLYSSVANRVDVSSAGRKIFSLIDNAGPNLILNPDSTNKASYIYQDLTASELRMSAGTGTGTGRSFRMYANDHATNANIFAWYRNTTIDGTINNSGLWTIGATGSTQVHAVNGSLSATVELLSERVGVGGGASASSYVFVGNDTTAVSGTTQRGVRVSGSLATPTFSSAATTSMLCYQSDIRTQDAVYTTSLLVHFSHSQANLGANHTVTREVAYRTSGKAGVGTVGQFAVLADNSTFVGDHFISQTGVNPSVFGGPVTLGSLGTQTHTVNGNIALTESNVRDGIKVTGTRAGDEMRITLLNTDSTGSSAFTLTNDAGTETYLGITGSNQPISDIPGRSIIFSGNQEAFWFANNGAPAAAFVFSNGFTNASRFLRIASTEVTAYLDVAVATAGKGLRVAEGSNAKQGVATLVAGTVTVSNTSVTANSRIFLTHQNNSGTVGFVTVSARTVGTDFTITSSSATDTSDIAWEIFEPA